MTLAVGTRLGPYDITGAIGAGGMGEVYRARDPRLGREVAIKVLPSDVASDRARMARFEREARTASALTHPNIVTIHDVGHSNGTAYLVMELVSGRALADMVHAPLPLDTTLLIATQIAEALAAAHASGIVHRDLKPANIMVTPQNTAKVLDFGLAKAGAGEATPADAKTDVMVSAPGEVYGTLPYMSPEQIAGKPVDFRSDQYSFALIVVEMLTGKRGADIPADVPLPLRWILERCLDKDPARRYASTADLARDLSDVPKRVVSDVVPGARKRSVAPFIALAVGGLAFIAIFFTRSRGERGEGPAYLALHVPEVAEIPMMEVSPSLAISPDGQRVAVAGIDAAGQSALWVRDIASTKATRLAGTEEARSPTWSPDGRQLAFLADGKLKTVTANGGPPAVLYDSFAGTTLTWASPSTIIFNNLVPDSDPGLFLISTAGGPPRRLTKVDVSRSEAMHLWPEILPDGKQFLFVSRHGRFDANNPELTLTVGTIDGGPVRAIGPIGSRMLVRGDTAYHVVGGTLLGQKFDSKALRFNGEPVPIASGFHHFFSTGSAEFSVSANGTVCVQSAREVSRLIVLNRTGQQIRELGRAAFRELRISPDGTTVAAIATDISSGTSNIWLYPLSGKTATRVTFDDFDERAPVWTRDGRSILFRSDILGPPDIMRIDLADNRRSLVIEAPGVQEPLDTSADGRLLYQNAAGGIGRTDFKLLSLKPGVTAAELPSTPFLEREGRISPSGRSLAFASFASGRSEIYVGSLSTPSTAQPISLNGGTNPRWSASGRELIYMVTATDLMRVTVRETATGIEVSEPELLMRSPHAIGDYDVTPDGANIVIRTIEEKTTPPIQLVINAPHPM